MRGTANEQDVAKRWLRAESYFQLRELNRANRFPQIDPAEVAARRERIRAWGRPPLLTATQYQGGQLQWPRVLMHSIFDGHRKAIDQLCHRSMSEFAPEITTLTRQMEDQLDHNFHTFGQESYLAGSRFLRSLLRQVREQQDDSVRTAKR